MKQGRRRSFLKSPNLAHPAKRAKRSAGGAERRGSAQSLHGRRARRRIMESRASGTIKVVVGKTAPPRLRTPEKKKKPPGEKTGLIVIDEEHENSFKRSGPPRYHARDVRPVHGARLEDIPIMRGPRRRARKMGETRPRGAVTRFESDEPRREPPAAGAVKVIALRPEPGSDRQALTRSARRSNWRIEGRASRRKGDSS